VNLAAQVATFAPCPDRRIRPAGSGSQESVLQDNLLYLLHFKIPRLRYAPNYAPKYFCLMAGVLN
ncbi:hypothetical protein, partial [Yersinia aldovae]|uniref:hypothetical protein n=1 Tax=Yersinia aldovae TaxID=29483 RepID=UPI001C952FDB